MIDPILNQNVSNSTRVTSIEKVNPSQPVKDFMKDTTEQQRENDKTPVKINRDKMEEVVKGMNDFIQPIHTSVKFELHDKLNDYYVTVVDDQSNEVIKEIPSKKLLDTYATMMEFVGLLVDEKA